MNRCIQRKSKFLDTETVDGISIPVIDAELLDKIGSDGTVASKLNYTNNRIDMQMNSASPENEDIVNFESVKKKIRFISRLLKRELEKNALTSRAAINGIVYIHNVSSMHMEDVEEEAFKRHLQISDILVEERCTNSLAAILRELVDKGLSIRFVESEEFTKNDLIVLVLILNIIHDNSDASTNVCQSFAKTDLFDTVLIFLRELYKDHHDKKLHSVVDKLIYDAISAVYNHLIHEELDLVDMMNEIGMVTAIQPYLTEDDEKIRAAALLFTIHAVTQEEAAKSCSDEVSIRFILNSLQTAIHDKQRRGNGYSVEELTRALAKLSALDVNKKKLCDLGSIELLKELIEKGLQKDIEVAIKILWQLAFDAENARRIREANIVELLEKYMDSEDVDELKRATEGLMWTLNENSDENTNVQRPMSARRISSRLANQKEEMEGRVSSISNDLSKTKSDSHIMISYEWGAQQTIVRIKDLISEEGHKVWLDVENMGHNTLDSMAAAVENSWLILMSVSRKYKESENCRLEAEYAFRLKKPIIPLMMDKYRPDGWLGFIIGAKLYYDFSGKYDFQTKLVELLSAINKKIGGDIKIYLPDKVKPPSTKDHENLIVPSSVADDQMPVDTKDLSFLDNWEAAQVIEWFRDNDIERTGSMSISGKELKFLATARKECPEFFYRCMETKLKLRSLRQMANFVDAVNRLYRMK